MRNPATGKFDKNLNPKAIEFRPSHRINPHVTLPQPHCPYIPYHPRIYSCASCSPPAPFPVPTRAVLLISVPGDATESTVRREFGAFGEVRRVQMERLHEGMVTVRFYDSRHAEAAVARTGRMGTAEAARGIRALYAAASSPEEALEEQGILAILGLHDGISPNKLKETFEVVGPVKEVRKGPVEGPWFVEFFDVRDAATALSQLNPNESFGAASRKPLLRSSPWKGGESSHEETRSLIIEDAEEESEFKDTRTTLMIKNIPNKYSRSLLTRTLDDHCVKCNEKINDEGQPLSSFDFLYLPIDFNNKCNVGYGFINMTTPQAAWRLYKAFHLQHWELVNSRKICQVTYARLQGLEALKGHFQNWKLGGMKEEYLPVMFSPPRDGKLLTEPIPVTELDGSLMAASTTKARHGMPPKGPMLTVACSQLKVIEDGAS